MIRMTRARCVAVALVWQAGVADFGWSEESASAPEGYATIEEAVGRLDDDRFEEREKAMLFVWEHGSAAQPLLETAAREGNPEVRMRAQRILEAFRLGVFPDTPLDELEVIYDFHQGDIRTKEQVIRRLCQRGQLKLAQRLIRAVPSGAMQTRLVALASGSLKRALFPLLEVGDYQKARETLAWMAIDDSGMRDYAAFVVLTEQVDVALDELRQREGPAPADWKIEGWIMRAQGRMEDAVRLGTESGDIHWQDSVRAAGGDASAYARAHLMGERIGEGERLAFDLTLAGLRGDAEGFDERRRRLIAWAQRPENLPEQALAVQALLINGEVESALPLIDPAGAAGADVLLRDSAFAVRIFQGTYGKALDLIGLGNAKPPFTTWTDRVQAEFQAGNFERFPEALELAGHLFGMGAEAEARRIYGWLFSVFGEDAERLNEVIGQEVSQGAGDLAIEHMLKQREQGREMDSLLTFFSLGSQVVRLGGGDASERWWELIRKTNPAEAEKESLESLWTMLMPDPSNEDTADVERWLEAAAKWVQERSDAEKADWYITLYATAAAHRLSDEAFGYLEKAAEARPTGQILSILGELAARHQDWDKSLAYHEKAWKLHSVDVTNGQADANASYRYGRALVRVGQVEKGESMMRLARLLPLGNPAWRHRLAVRMLADGDRDEAIEELTLAARLSDIDEGSTKSIFDSLAEAVADDDPGSAALYQERALVEALPLRVNYLYRHYLSMRMQVLKWRALGLAKEGNVEAAAMHVDDYVRLAPGNASVGEQLLPMLEDVGLDEKARVLYEKTRAYCLEAVNLYPRSAMALNNLAWLDARSRRNLDEALTTAQLAVGLRPGTAAYVDTLAEVYFMMGDRDTALRYSRQAVALDPEDRELQGQLRRFETAPLPQPRAEE